ncbi:MAG: glycosyltransferase [Bacteroidia bacterium]|nr:glycosyltransferase [Bacteroidia bacterium]
MKFAFIGTYPPRQCGIGTFTQDLYQSIVKPGGQPGRHEGFIIALNDHDQMYRYSDEVAFSIRQEHQRDYVAAAKFINLSGADICVLEHEYGIFGGQSGVYILPLLHRLEIPLIVTLHTVLKDPSYNEKAILQEICKMAAKVVVMAHKAVEFLTTLYDVDPEKIELIHHGVPDIHFNQEQVKKEFKLENRKVILTFGFIGRNKGIETVIKALPEVIKKHPEVIYLVLGKTHPNVIRYSGEEYRNYLQRLTSTLHLNKHVYFLNEFTDQKLLFKYLSASDIYVTPYLNEAQITSGTLSYSVGVGSGVISTPYWHAEELLSDGRGKLFPFNDSEALSDILLDLLDHPEKLNEMRQRAYEYGREMTWERSGERYIEVARDACSQSPQEHSRPENILDPTILPEFSLLHIKRLTDDTGIIQHAKFGIPNLKEGYCLDDHARALLMVLMAYRQTRDKEILELAPIYLSYIHYMQNKDGSFRNFLSFNRNFLDEVGSEDSFGRTIWALGYLLGNAPNDAYYQTGKSIFFAAVPCFERLKSIRGLANTMTGISYYLRRNSTDEGMIQQLRTMAYTLVNYYKNNRNDDWEWFEDVITYDNGMLPLALFHAAEILNDEEILSVANRTMNFLTKLTQRDGYLSIIGNEKWLRRGGERSIFAQQPVDALAMVLMYQQAFHVTRDRELLKRLFTCFMWFLGENDIRMSLFDFETWGCCDGIENYGINRNQGAESSLAYLISHLTVLQAFEEYEDAEIKVPEYAH